MNGEMKEELAYLAHFGLEVNPFPVSPDVEHFFLSRDIDRLITEIVHGILTRKGFMVLTGEVGLGKTTKPPLCFTLPARIPSCCERSTETSAFQQDPWSSAT
jgi:hypothetical protein